MMSEQTASAEKPEKKSTSKKSKKDHEDFDGLIKAADTSKSVAIFAHRCPDPDAPTQMPLAQ